MSDSNHQLATTLRHLAKAAEDGNLACHGIFALMSSGDRFLSIRSFDPHTAYMLAGGISQLAAMQGAAIANFEARAAQRGQIVAPGAGDVAQVERSKN